MPRESSDKKVEAEKLFDKGMKLVEIARKLDIPEGTVRSWKNRGKWGTGSSEEKQCNVAKEEGKSNATLQKRKRGGQPGNRNAQGAKGGAAPLHNKNAVRTGEFEALFFDTLEEDEKKLVNTMPCDKAYLLIQEIRLLTVREHRMLKRIRDIGTSAGNPEDGEQMQEMTMVKRQAGIEKGKVTDLNEYQGKLGQIQSVEDALTRVQARKQKAIDSLHRFGFDDARLEIELMKLDLAAMKMDTQNVEIGDDGFLEALNGEAGCLWGDADG